jgi:hypothetical protein
LTACYLQSYSFTNAGLLVALLIITLVALKITLSSKEDTLSVSVALAISKVAFAVTATLRPFKKLLYINIALR